MAEKPEYCGHKTVRAPDGSVHHEPLTAAEAQSLWAAAEQRQAARAALMPTEEDAVRHLAEAYRRLQELGWRDVCYCPKDGTEFRVVEPGGGGFPTCYAEGDWPDTCWWCPSDGDVWPSRPILFKA